MLAAMEVFPKMDRTAATDTRQRVLAVETTVWTVPLPVHANTVSSPSR